MPTSLYEIVMLPNGDVILQRADHTEEPVVTISFSEDAKAYLQEARLDIARIMIDAGIDAVEQLSADEVMELMEEAEAGGDRDTPARILH